MRRHRDEQRGEDLRLAYVALTRAKHQAVIWWAGSFDSRNSPLGRLLFAESPTGTSRPEGRSTPSDAAADERFAELAAQAPGCVSVERSTLGRARPRWSPPAEPPVELAAARFDRGLDPRGGGPPTATSPPRRTTPVVASEPERGVLTDEPETPTPVAVADAVQLDLELLGVQSPLGDDAGRGRVRDVRPHGARGDRFQRAGPRRRAGRARGRRPARRRARRWVSRARSWRGSAGRDRDAARAAGWTAPGYATSAAARPAGRARVRAAARRRRRADRAADARRRSRRRCGPTWRRVIRWPVRRAARGPRARSSVRGYLTGSIDLVMRIGTPRTPRFAIVDYKTNWLGPAGEALTLAHYRPGCAGRRDEPRALRVAGAPLHVALHRYLRWRLPGYQAERHLAGVLYLFVRGMAGERRDEAGCSRGVHRRNWSWPSATAGRGVGVSAVGRSVRRAPRGRAPPGCCAIQRDRAAVGGRRSCRARGWPSWRARRARRCGWPWHSRCAARGSATCSSTWRRSPTRPASSQTSRSICPRCPGRPSG